MALVGNGGPGRQETPRARLPLLDRLIDEAPEVAVDPPLPATETLALLRRGLRRDLEALLNARRRWRSWPDELTELNVSAVGYGIPDFTAGALNDPKRRERLRAEIEQTLRRFEPRFTSVHVRVVDAGDTQTPTLRLRIEALLHAEPAPEPVAFDTQVDATTAEVRVREGNVDV